MRHVDAKAAAQQRFARADWNERGMDLVERCATDPPLVVAGLVDAVRERAGVGSRVGELGFGSGWLLDALVALPLDATLYGLDMSPGVVRHGYQRFSERVSILMGDMEQLPFCNESLDVIVTCWTLYFMNDIDRALQEIKRCLRKGGRLIAATNAHDHEAECGELVSEAIRVALGRNEPEHDIAWRFDFEAGEQYVRHHFPTVELRRWRGEMVIKDREDIAALWPKWEPALFAKQEQQAVRAQFLRLAYDRLEREGALRIRRRNGAFVCDLDEA
ncbi:MAG: class I SAM-dependent methyltransferase [Dehalococcoidia bacterium]